MHLLAPYWEQEAKHQRAGGGVEGWARGETVRVLFGLSMALVCELGSLLKKLVVAFASEWEEEEVCGPYQALRQRLMSCAAFRFA